MSPELKKGKESREKEAYLASFIHEKFPPHLGGDRLSIFPGDCKKPVVTFTPEADIIKFGPSKLENIFGNLNFALVRVWVLLGWKAGHNNCVVDLDERMYPQVISRKKVIFDPDLSLVEQTRLFSNLERWGAKNIEEIWMQERTLLSIMFLYQFDPKSRDFMTNILRVNGEGV